jgi:hypothetical protein
VTAALPNPELDARLAQLSDKARRAVQADGRRVVVVGARGWIGRTILSLLHEALDPAQFAERVACFGSRAGVVDLDGVRWRRLFGQFGGLAKVGSGSFYAASLRSGLALSGASPG